MTQRRYILAAALLLVALAARSPAGALFRPGKIVVNYYRCELDGTDQPYSAWLPRNYDPRLKWPLVIQLHGLGGSYRIGGVRREIEDCVVVAPDGRGATDYKLWGELDIIRVLEDVKRRYSIDDDRVCLYGGSMGGSGSWQLGVHFPDRFAALGPVCGNADHRVWEKLWNWGETNPTWMSARKRWVEATESAAFFAENLLHLPAYAIHGDRDNVVPCDHSRSMVAEMRNAGCEVIFSEVEGAGHGVPGNEFPPMLEWMKKQKRNRWPKRVVFKTAWRRHPGAYWVRIHRFERAFAFARIEAEQLAKRSVRVKTDNVEAFSLQLVPPLFDKDAPIRVEVNGKAGEHRAATDGWLRLRKHGEAWRPSKEPTGLHKTPDLEGPITHAFMTPFVIVYGTHGTDERAKRVARDEANILKDRWNRWARGRARVKADRDVKPDDIARLNLILVGDPATNSLIPRVNARLPIRIERNAIVFGDRRFEGNDVGVKCVYPNPLNPKRYVVLFSGTTWRGVYQIVGRFGNWFDWGILDGWHWQDFAVFDDHSYSPETFLAVGYFDNDWKINPAWHVVGDEKLRKARPPRRTPQYRTPPEGIGQLYLSDLEPAYVKPEKGVVARDRSFNALPLTLGERTFERGLGVHPNCDIGFDLDGRFPTFEAVVGSDLEGEQVSEARDKAESFEFMVIGDGRMIYQTGRMRWHSEPRSIYVPIAGVNRLELKIHRRSGPRWLSGPVDWAIAKVGEPVHNTVAVRTKFQPNERLVERRPLDGPWKLAGFPAGEGIAHGAHRGEPDALEAAIETTVPGSVFAALGSDTSDATLREWWYWRSFDVPKEWAGSSMWVELDGAAYQADCWLNGRWIGRTIGPFAAGRLDATRGVKLGGRNTLAIRVVASPADWAKGGRPFQPASASSLVTSQALARSGHPPLGIWRPVRLTSAGPCLLRGLHVETVELGENEARLRVAAHVVNIVKDRLEVGLQILVGDDQTVERKLQVDGGKTETVELELRLPAPKLWWPRELGDQPLYRLRAVLEVAGRAVSDEHAVQFGVRTVELDTSTTAARLRINGRRTMDIRGVVWLPADALLRLDGARYQRLLARARECGFNTLRVWGGGLAETDAFYDLCDRMGFLVLQEFPLTSDAQAGAADDFLRNCGDTILRLRSHPSLAAWCVGGAVRPNAAPEPRLTAEVAALCGQLDPQRRLIADSPETGQAQIWTVRADPKTRRTYWRGASVAYTPGIASPSMPSTLRAALGRELPWPAAGQWPTSRAAGPSSSARDHILKAQVAQAAALQRVLERRRAAPTSEVLWQLNEPLASSSPALVDAAGALKPACYFLRRARAPLAIFADLGRAMPTTLPAGERLVGEVCVQSRGRPLPGATATATILDRTLRTLASWRAEAGAGEAISRPLLLDWSPARSLVGDVVFLHLRLDDAAGNALASNLYWLGITPPERTEQEARLRVGWLTSRPRGILADKAFLDATGIAVEHPEHKAPEPLKKKELDEDPDEDVLGAGPKLQLDGYDVLVIDAATVFDDHTDADLLTVAEAVAKGAGLLIDGESDDLLASSLDALVPLGYPAGLATGVARRPVAADPTHPVLRGVSFAGCPVLPRRASAGLRKGAWALVQLDAAHPLVAETRHGRGRAVQLTGRLSGQLAAWDDARRFHAALLGYLGGLPHRDLVALVDAAEPAPLGALDRLGTAHVEASVRQDGEAVLVELGNPSAVLAFTVHLEAEPDKAMSAAPPLLFSDNFLSLLPGERRTIRITTDPAAPAADGRFHLILRGWNLSPRPLDRLVAIHDGRLTLRRR